MLRISRIFLLNTEISCPRSGSSLLSLISQNILWDKTLEEVLPAFSEMYRISFFLIAPAVGQYKLPSAQMIEGNLTD